MDWQPIETAPKDGTAVLLWGVAAGEISGIIGQDPCFQGSGYYTSRTDYPGYDWVCCQGDAYAVWIKPTHWAPIEPPKEEK